MSLTRDSGISPPSPSRAWLPFPGQQNFQLIPGQVQLSDSPIQSHGPTLALVSRGWAIPPQILTVSQGDLASGSGCCLPSALPTEAESSLLSSSRERGSQDRRDLKGNEGRSLSSRTLSSLSLFTRRCDPQHRGVKLLPIWGGGVALSTLSESSFGRGQGCALPNWAWLGTGLFSLGPHPN